MIARAVDIDHREVQPFKAKREGCGNRKFVNRMAAKFEHPIIPRGDNAPRGAVRRFENECAQGGGRKVAARKGGMAASLDS